MPAAVCEGIDVRFQAGGTSDTNDSNDTNGANGADGIGGIGGGGGAGVGAVLSGYFRCETRVALPSAPQTPMLSQPSRTAPKGWKLRGLGLIILAARRVELAIEHRRADVPSCR